MTDDTKPRATRYELNSIEATLDGDPVEIVDVSPTGVLLRDVEATFERGDAVTVHLNVPLMNKRVPVEIDGFVVRSDERGLAVDYVKPAITWPHVLRVLDSRER